MSLAYLRWLAMTDLRDDVLRTLRTEAVEDFLKAVYMLERQRIPVPTSLLANTLGIKPPSVTEMAKKLAENGLLEYEKYKGLRLTEPGRQIALEVIRHHRLIEMYLMEALGYTWDEVHEEADRLEHVISEQFEARIAEALSHPAYDPHGDPIPAADGTIPHQDLIPVAKATLNAPYTVHRISDQSPEMLRYLAGIGLVLGARIVVRNRDPFAGPVHLQVDDQHSVIAESVSHLIFVVPAAE